MALMAVADAFAAILDGVTPLPEEMVGLDAAHRRVLTRDLPSRRSQPPVGQLWWRIGPGNYWMPVGGRWRFTMIPPAR